MTDQQSPPPVERNPMYERAFARQRTRQKGIRYLRRFGCGILIVIWIGVLLLPCAFVTLLVEKEITLSRSDIPGDEYRLFLLEEPDQRGIGFSRTKTYSGDRGGDTVCLLTDVDYLLWEGSGEGSVYCNCYEKLDSAWSPTVVGADANCEPQVFDLETD